LIDFEAVEQKNILSQKMKFDYYLAAHIAIERSILHK